MERIRKSKIKPTLDSVFFATPEQKLMKFLLTEPTTAFTPRVLSSKLKGVRGLGGAEGINRILKKLEEIGLVTFVNHNREVAVQNENSSVQMLKVIASVCDLEGLRALLMELSAKVVLFGTHSSGLASSGSEFDLFVISNRADEVERVVSTYPNGKKIRLHCWSPQDATELEKRDRSLAEQLRLGIVLWDSAW